MSDIPTLKDGTQFACDEIIREQDKEIEHLRATELAHASTITELSLKVGDLRLDAENGWAARDHWKKKCEAKDAVVEAARELEHIHADHAECRDVDDAICRCTLCIALRALDKPTCKTCGGSGELKDAVQAWDIPGAPIPDCPDCGGDDE